MKKISVMKNEMYLVGLKTRTNNQRESQIETAKIPTIIQTYVNGPWIGEIRNRKNFGVILSVYTEYENDYNGDYTYFFGEEVSDLSDVPEGLETLIIPAQKYTKFKTQKGNIPTVVIEGWQEIWKMSSEDIGGERAYVADFEAYGESAVDYNDAEVDIYIGVK
jgi:predicted transcriptional regulator YdeE